MPGLIRQLDVLRVQIEEKIKIRSESVAGGACMDFGDYRNATGVIRGMQNVLVMIDEIEDDMRK